MNLNRGATEIDADVHNAERYVEGMANPDDDRGEALAWFFRLLIEQELERGVTRTELLQKLGIKKGHLSQIENGKLGIGVPKLIQFAPYFGKTPGELLQNALSWWDYAGRKEKARALLEQAEAAALRASESGEHPSQSPLKAAK